MVADHKIYGDIEKLVGSISNCYILLKNLKKFDTKLLVYFGILILYSQGIYFVQK